MPNKTTGRPIQTTRPITQHGSIPHCLERPAGETSRLTRPHTSAPNLECPLSYPEFIKVRVGSLALSAGVKGAGFVGSFCPEPFRLPQAKYCQRPLHRGHTFHTGQLKSSFDGILNLYNEYISNSTKHLTLPMCSRPTTDPGHPRTPGHPLMAWVRGWPGTHGNLPRYAVYSILGELKWVVL